MNWTVRGLVCGLVVTLALGWIVQAQVATPGQSLAWSHPTASAELVTRFETKYDAAAVYTDVGVVAHPTLADTYYAPLPSLVTGSHTVVVRACNANGCSADSTVFTFSMVAGVPTVISGGSILIIQTP